MDGGIDSFFRSCCASLTSVLYEVNLVTRDGRVGRASCLLTSRSLTLTQPRRKGCYCYWR